MQSCVCIQTQTSDVNSTPGYMRDYNHYMQHCADYPFGAGIIF